MSGKAPKQDIIVIGASAGGVEALTRLARDLPPDLPAAIFVVLHVGAASHLPASSIGPVRCRLRRPKVAKASSRGASWWRRPGRTCCCTTGTCC